jgi:hypothetical protein
MGGAKKSDLHHPQLHSYQIAGNSHALPTVPPTNGSGKSTELTGLTQLWNAATMPASDPARQVHLGIKKVRFMVKKWNNGMFPLIPYQRSKIRKYNVSTLRDYAGLL